VGYDPTRSRQSARSRALIRRTRSPEPTAEMERGTGNDPATSCLASKRSPTELPPHIGGDGRNRTDIGCLQNSGPPVERRPRKFQNQLSLLRPRPSRRWRLVLGLPRTCRVDQKMKNPSRADAPEGFADLSIFFPDPNLRAEHLHAYAGRADWRCAHTSARRTTAVGGVRADMRLSTCGVTIPCDTHSISQRENQLPSRVPRHATLGFDERLASV
jgi:hypothetical protein